VSVAGQIRAAKGNAKPRRGRITHVTYRYDKPRRTRRSAELIAASVASSTTKEDPP